MKKVARCLTLSSLLLPCLLFLSGCFQADDSASATGTIAASGTLAIFPSTITVSPGGQVDFTASGGSGVYSYYSFSSGTTINSSSGIYTASSTLGTYYVEVVDTNNNNAMATVTVSTSATTGTLSFSPSSETILPSASVNLSVTGGSGNYTYSFASGTGTLTPGSEYVTFTAPATEETVSIEVTDTTTSDTAFATVTVSSTASTTTTTTPVTAQNVQLYRLYNKSSHDYLISSLTNEGTTEGYVFQENAFIVLSNSSVSGSVPLYRCHTNDYHHLVTTDSACEGYTMEGTLGYVMPTGSANYPMPIYRFALQNSDNGQATLPTLSYSEGTSGNMSFQMILGYVSGQ